MTGSGLKQAVDFLIKKSNSQGYVSLDDILSCGKFFNLEVDDVERLTDAVLDNGIIIKDVPQIVKPEDVDDPRKDYSSIYDSVVLMDPSLKWFVDYVRKIRPADKREMVGIQYQLLEGNKYAWQRAIEGNLRTVVYLAFKEAVANNKNIADCIGDACLALVSACDSYRPDEHQTFASYIGIAIVDYFARTTDIPLFAIPVNIANVYRKLQKDCKYKYLDRNDAVQYSCSFYGLEENWSMIFYNLIHLELTDVDFVDSLKAPVQIENFFEIFDTDVENNFERKNVELVIQRFIDVLLNKREKDIVEKRYGLNGQNFFSLEELRLHQGVSKERIRQIEISAISKLKKQKNTIRERISFFCD